MNQRIAAKALITNGRQMLLLREAASDIEATQVGNYQVPGGRIEPGESFFDGLKREVKEETGLIVTIGQPAFVCEWFPTIRGQANHIIAVFVACTTTSTEVKLSSEHDDFVWVDARTINDYPLIASEADQVKDFLHALN